MTGAPIASPPGKILRYVAAVMVWNCMKAAIKRSSREGFVQLSAQKFLTNPILYICVSPVTIKC